MTHETTNIPLNKLVAWEGNVRKTGASDRIDELAASIAAHGLLQSLVVRKATRGKYAVVAGQRRLMALQSLAKAKTVPADTEVPCRVVDAETDATELSLAENVVRMPMHPADQFEAFRDLVENGATIADVAARFGVTEPLVSKRLKLGRVSPVILESYRKGEIDLELVQAFTISDDHEAQERVLSELPAWDLRPHTIKRALTEGEIPASDKRVRMIGLEAYEAAGGAVRRDLFDQDDGGYVLDTALLDRLATQQLEQAADEVRSEGWKWTEIRPTIEYGDLDGFQRLYPEDAPLSEEDQSELDRLTAEYDELVDTDDEAETARLDEIDRRIDELAAAGQHWPAETLEIAGAIISIGYQGEIRIERGLVRPEDRPAVQRKDDARSSEASSEPAIRLSAKLIEDLTAQKSAAISAELAKNPEIALATVVHALALPVFYNGAGDRTCLQISLSPTALRCKLQTPEDCTGLAAREAEHERWGHHLPRNPAELWSWCLEQPRDVLLDLLAVLAAHSVDAVLRKGERPDSASKRHADAVAKAISLDMADYFTPTAANFFGRINGAGIQAAICEAKGGSPAPGWAKLKKAELAILAERQIAGTGWQPAPLRIEDEEDATLADREEGDDRADSDELPEAAE